jgi:hypothetical protein
MFFLLLVLLYINCVLLIWGEKWLLCKNSKEHSYMNMLIKYKANFVGCVDIHGVEPRRNWNERNLENKTYLKLAISIFGKLIS